MKLGFRQAIVSASVFVALLLLLALWDGRVREQFGAVFHGEAQQRSASLGARVAEFGGVLLDAVRYSTLDNGPMVAFAAVGAVLVLFMLRT